eukprot:351563-Chlamydomonas_euryale.AAC.2
MFLPCPYFSGPIPACPYYTSESGGHACCSSCAADWQGARVSAAAAALPDEQEPIAEVWTREGVADGLEGEQEGVEGGNRGEIMCVMCAGYCEG